MGRFLYGRAVDRRYTEQSICAPRLSNLAWTVTAQKGQSELPGR
jgi:hypothetical protein